MIQACWTEAHKVVDDAIAKHGEDAVMMIVYAAMGL